MHQTKLQTNWTLEQALAAYQQPFNDLLFQAQQVHRQRPANLEPKQGFAQ